MTGMAVVDAATVATSEIPNVASFAAEAAWPDETRVLLQLLVIQLLQLLVLQLLQLLLL